MTSAWRGPARAILSALALLVPMAVVAPSASAAPPAPGALKINEVESSAQNDGPDFVELINNGAVAADIGGYVIRDNDPTHTFTIPAGTTIAAGGYYVAETDTGPGAFGLGSADSVRLYAQGAVAPTDPTVDSYTWTAHADTTYGRCPNGTGAFITTGSSTKGAINDCGIRINEIESDQGSPGDFVELINTSAITADVGGYVFRDSDPANTYTVPAGTTIVAGGYLVIEIGTISGGFGLGGSDSGRLFAPGGVDLLDSYSWTAHAMTTYGRCPNGTGPFTTTVSSTKGAANNCPAVTVANVKINEVESDGGSPGDFIEIINNGSTAADIGGYVVRDNDPSQAYSIPAGTTIAAGGHFVVEIGTVAGGFGLGGADSARLFAPDGLTLVDTYTWTTHAGTTYGRCPNGTGPFATTSASTKGTANLCGGDVPASPWPGSSAVSFADGPNVFGSDLSGLAYEPSGSDTPGVLWAVRNGTGTLFRLIYDGTKWTPDPANGWLAGKQMRYTDGAGVPDAEGVTVVDDKASNGVFVATERNGTASGTSRPAVLRFDVSSPATTLTATKDFSLTADLPALGANTGPEAVQWISDAFLVAKGFRDESTGAAYNPATHPNHGSGLFFVGVEQSGTIYAYALNQTTGAATRVATIASGFPAVMGLEFEAETGHLWAMCDNGCQGRTTTLDIAQGGANAGRFVETNRYERPTGMANLNNEGFTITPQEECVDGKKPVYWADDGNTEMHALRAGTLNCTVLAKAQTITFDQPAAIPFGSDPVPLRATATSQLLVGFTATGPCSVSGSTAAPTLTASGAGTCTVTARQQGNAAFKPATPVVRTVTITRAPTRLVHAPVSLLRSGLSLRVRYTAVLTSRVTGRPLAGQTVTFSVRGGRTVACTDVTDSAGKATCNGPLLSILSLVLQGGSTARFAGTIDYESSTDTARLTL